MWCKLQRKNKAFCRLAIHLVHFAIKTRPGTSCEATGAFWVLFRAKKYLFGIMNDASFSKEVEIA